MQALPNARRALCARQQVGQAITGRVDCPCVTDSCPRLLDLQVLLPRIQLDAQANEGLLLHGSSGTESIVRQGFDDRTNRRALYGIGAYTTIDSCTAGQYSEGGEVVVTRSILGHPFLGERGMRTRLRPSEVDTAASTRGY